MTCLQPPSFFNHPMMWKRASVSSGQRLGRVTSVHLTETCEEDHPNLVTNVATTVATVPDTELLDPMHAHLAERDLLPSTHLVDDGYVDAGIGVPAAMHHVEVLGPVRADTNWQARQGQG
jgi:transposase